MKKLVTFGCACAMAMGSAAVSAYEKDDVLLRFGAASVFPDDTNANAGVSVDGNTQLGLNVVYMASDNVGFELLAASPFTHDVKLNGDTIGETKQLPPTVSMQWYFNNNSIVTPYLGVGFNYTFFWDSKAGLGGDVQDVNLKDSFGFAANAGLDIEVADNWLVNASVYKMQMETEVLNGPLKGTGVTIDPVVVMLSAGYKF
ncbi:Outer membrane protein W [BD1-7 clade bacterium]|uniref:Outer membrane protein W n=1 Tax=BD1-7 clade bacterium TaxID=2029982 RepID=A0A5S9QLQ6_9GAMM|nr:Outer membrane protein W [BD1-7 clade bacterium]